ncbi:hypothetical protein M5K25_002713 [Dendrobium thyrsiflorum]|uniref:Transmembrane protein n=1 Tax=Dendrobium thyrsiflorum TaxID=117978 RepID=A0ABD0VNX6_DENTH
MQKIKPERNKRIDLVQHNSTMSLFLLTIIGKAFCVVLVGLTFQKLTETLEESVRVRERLRFGEKERSCEGLSEEITEVSQDESLVLLISLFSCRLVKSCVKTPISAWVLCLHRGVVKKEEAVLCRRKWFSAITKEWYISFHLSFSFPFFFLYFFSLYPLLDSDTSATLNYE